ncbi:MAG: hypothetical protein JST58_10560 [Bacteroidetes bacterium]|nr:hypothetical protein [Bacteroidota bacterium]
MYSYALLEKNCHYLIQEKEGDPISLIKINFETDHCAYVSKFTESTINEWRKKTDPIFDILELLDDDKVKEWESVYNDGQDTYNYEEDED